jgi:hypothetical protein
MKIDNQVYSSSVDKWIAQEPVLLYQAVMGKVRCCVVYPTMEVYTPSLQLPVLKKLEAGVKKIRPELVLGKNIRKICRKPNHIL